MKNLAGYSHIKNLIENDQCVILDGAIATELQRSGIRGWGLKEDIHWGLLRCRTIRDSCCSGSGEGGAAWTRAQKGQGRRNRTSGHT